MSETTPPRVLGDIGSKLLFENDRVRVWRLTLEPGERSATHQHELDYLLVKIAGDTVGLAPEPDTGSEWKEPGEWPVKPGQTDFIERGGIETAYNPGTQRYHEVIIELKDTPG